MHYRTLGDQPIESQSTNPIRGLEDRLAPRRAAEARHHKGPTAHGHTDLLLRADRALGPLLKLALKGTGLYGRGLRNALQLRVRHLRFEFSNLPPWLHGFRILHLSDVHIDGVRGLTTALCDCVREIPVDLCVLTGDYRFEVDGPCDGVYPHIERLLRAVRTRTGVLGILGNHDEADMAIVFEHLGVRMLINESTEVEPSFWVIGVDDAHYYGCADLSESLVPVPPDAFKLLLAHTPELYAEADRADIDLYLCGHTHAGQICLPHLGAPFLNVCCPRTFARGRWQHGRTQGFTTAGAGCSLLPVRYNCPPEVALVELVAAAD